MMSSQVHLDHQDKLKTIKECSGELGYTQKHYFDLKIRKKKIDYVLGS